MLQILCWTLSFRVWALSNWLFPWLELFFSASPVATRYVSPFLRCIKRCCKEQEQVFQKTGTAWIRPKGGDFLWNASLNLSQWRQHLPLQLKKAKLRGDRRQNKGRQSEKETAAIHSWKLYRSARSLLWMGKTGCTLHECKKADRKHCFLPLKRGKSMWLSLVRSVPLYSLHNQVCHMDFSRSLISSGWHLPESGRFLTWKCPSEKDTPLKNKQQTHSCDKNHRNETACCPSRAVVCLRLQTPVRPRKYDKIITNTVLYPLRHPTCFGTSLYKKPYYLHRQ